MAFINENWLESALGAMRATFDVDTKTKTLMVQFLLDEGFWDSERLTWEAAIARFNSCLNPNKSEFFKMGEIWALMSRFGRHQLFHAMAEDLGYELRIIPTEERRQLLLERIATCSERFETEFAAARSGLERLTNTLPAAVPRIHPGQKAHFSVGDSVDSRTPVERMGCP